MPWLAVLKGTFALELTLAEIALFSAVAGGRPVPKKRVRELWAIAGRRSGKSRIAAALAAYAACFVPHKGARGQRPMCRVPAMSQDQATTVLEYGKGFLTASPALAREIVGETRSSVTL